MLQNVACSGLLSHVLASVVFLAAAMWVLGQNASAVPDGAYAQHAVE